MSAVIKVENLGKSYLVGHQSGRRSQRETMRDVVASGLRDMMRKTRDAFRGRQIVQGDQIEEFWALRDVSFQIYPGEVVGVIGRNGAGKSTLLKVLSRITEPTRGKVTLRGRIASLLEVGTGFHPELTGRENVFLNGAILGMTRQEIRKKFEEIVAFAEIEKFIDTPVKRYSSGMYVRLAFAVAAHLEPEILVVDEVLAVGDAEFQKRCLGKMESAANSGRTVIFVSHNLPAVQKLCSRALLMRKGQLARSGSVEECIAAYLDSGLSKQSLSAHFEQTRDTNESGFRFVTIRVCDERGKSLNHLTVGQVFCVEIVFEVKRIHQNVIVGFAVRSLEDFPIFATHNNDFGKPYRSLAPGRYRVTMSLTPNFLRPGSYSLSLGAIASGQLLCHISSALSFHIEAVASQGAAHLDERIGALFIPMKWSEPQPVEQ